VNALRAANDYLFTTGGMTEARLRMARVPEGAELIENPMSGAPGIRPEKLQA
jgi:molybdopterin-biosynthesis enzyme MoeA-like protein